MGTVSSEVAKGCLDCPELQWIDPSLGASMKEQTKLWLTHLHPALQSLIWIFHENLPLFPSIFTPWDGSQRFRDSAAPFQSRAGDSQPPAALGQLHLAPPALPARVSKGSSTPTSCLALLPPLGSASNWKKKCSLAQMSFLGGCCPLPAPQSSVAAGPGTSQQGGRGARATPWARGSWWLWNRAVNFLHAEFETSWWASN